MTVTALQIKQLAEAIGADIKALQTAIAGLGAGVDAMVYKGAIDASTNPNYPLANAGDTYRISVAGKIGGASGKTVEAGDMLISHVDSSAAGTDAVVGSNWDILQANIVGSSGAMAIGDVIAGEPAQSSVLFIGSGGVLAQDNASFKFDNVTDTLTVSKAIIGTGSPLAIGDPGIFQVSGTAASGVTFGTVNDDVGFFNLRSANRYWHFNARPSNDSSKFTLYHYNGSNYGDGELLSLTPTGVMKLSGLSGTGSRLVVADANGTMTATIATSAIEGLIGNDVITYAKIQNISSDSRILGRGQGVGSGDIQELTLGTGLSLTGTVLSVSGSGTGEVNTGSNIGTTGVGTAGVFKTKSGVDLQFRRLIGSGTVTITENTNDITITGAAGSGETATSLGTLISGTTAKTTPVDADLVPITDSAASHITKKVTWANVKATLKAYNDTLYSSGGGTAVYASSHSYNLTTALAAAANKTLVIDGNITYSGTTVIPATTQIAFTNGAILTVSSGQVTINNLIDPGNNKCFAGAGKVVITGTAIHEINLAWWHGTTSGLDGTTAFANAIYSMEQTNACKNLYIPAMSVLTTTGHDFQRDMRVRGAGRLLTIVQKSGAGGYVFRLLGRPAFGADNISIENMRINSEVGNADGTSASTIGILLSGAANDSMRTIILKNVRLHGFNVAYDIDSTDGGWEVLPIRLEDCYITWNKIGIRSDTINSGIQLHNTDFYIPASPVGTGISLLKVGSLHITGNWFAFGSESAGSNIPIINGTTFLYTETPRNVINIKGGQDEGLQYWMRNNSATSYEGVIVFEDNLIQSEVLLEGGATIHSRSNTYVAIARNGDDANVGIYRNVASGNNPSFIYSYGDYVENRPYGSPVPLSTYKLGYFTNYSTLATESSNLPGAAIKQRVYQKFNLDRFQSQTQDAAVIEISRDNTGGLEYGGKLIRMGQKNGDTWTNYYDISRSTSDGWLEISGSQENFRGIRVMNSDIEIVDNVRGIILKQPNGTRRRIRVGNDGVLFTELA